MDKLYEIYFNTDELGKKLNEALVTAKEIEELLEEMKCEYPLFEFEGKININFAELKRYLMEHVSYEKELIPSIDETVNKAVKGYEYILGYKPEFRAIERLRKSLENL